MTLGNIAHCFHIINFKRAAVAQVVSVFQKDKPASGEMNIIAANGGFNIFKRQLAVRLVGHGSRMNAANSSRPALFEKKGMRLTA